MPPQSSADIPPQRPPTWTASVFIIISAKAFSSVGFGLSLLAIWFGWALPNGVLPGQPQARIEPAPSEVLPTRKGHRRSRSSIHKRKSTSPKPTRRLSAPLPSPLPPIYGVHENAARPHPHRHVSFADSEPMRRNSDPTEAKSSEDSLALLPPANSELFQTVVIASPTSSTSSLNNPLPTPPPEDDRHSIRSDSPRPSTAPATIARPSTPVFRKFRLGFQSKRKPSQAPDLPTTPELDTNMALDPPEPPPSSTKRTFTPPWAHSKKSPPTDPLASLETASTRSSSSVNGIAPPKSATSTKACPSAPSFTFSRKPQRRTTAPIPRTQPYEAPYFATPPLLLDDSYSAYLRRLPRFEDDIHAPEVSGSGEPLDPSMRGRDSSSTERGVPRSNGQTTHSIPKRRAASEDWSPRVGLTA